MKARHEVRSDTDQKEAVRVTRFDVGMGRSGEGTRSCAAGDPVRFQGGWGGGWEGGGERLVWCGKEVVGREGEIGVCRVDRR